MIKKWIDCIEILVTRKISVTLKYSVNKKFTLRDYFL